MKRNIHWRNVIIAAILCWAFLSPVPVSSQTRVATFPAGRSKSKKTKKATSTKQQGRVNEASKPDGKAYGPDDQIPGTPYYGGKGITETVSQLMRRERNTPKKAFDPNFVEERPEVEEFIPKKVQPPGALAVPRFPYDPSDDNVIRNNFLPQAVGTSIAGPGRTADTIAAIPPDSVGDVGPTQVLMHVNGRVKVYDKFTGAVGGLDVADTTFWNSVRNAQGISDPRVEYDRLSGRWFLVMINVAATQNRIMIAVSSGPTITNSSSFTFYQITTATQFLDYPSLGVDTNALYIGGNIFTTSTGSFASTRGYVINKANLIAGTLTATVFNNLATGSVAGPYAPQGVSNDDPSATEGYFIGVDVLAFSLVQIRRVSNPGGVAPTISGNISLTVPTTVYPLGAQTGVGVPYQGVTGGNSLDDLDDRLFQAQILRDNVSGVSRLWTGHNIQVTAAGVASTTGGRDGSRWYEIGNLTTTPTLVQSGTLFDSAATNPNSFWIPSVAVSGQGHMAIGASSAGNSRFPALYASGRLRTDALGSNQAPTEIQSSTTTYNLQTPSPVKQRWGDYSKTITDPCDNQSMWHIGEYCDLTNSWRLRAVKLIAPPPPSSLTPSPSSAVREAPSLNVVVTGVSLAGSEFYDNPAGFTCNASCSTTGTGTCHIAAAVIASPLAPTAALTINSVTFNSPTQVTLNISTVGASAGTHTIQIRNPDGQATSFDFTVLAPTAAGVSISGRAVTSAGFGVTNVLITLTDRNGVSRQVITGPFGYYRFDDVETGQNYVISATSKRFQFSSRIVSVNDELTDLDLVAQ